MSRRDQLLARVRPMLVCTSCRIGLSDGDRAGDGAGDAEGNGHRADHRAADAPLVCRRCRMTVRRDGGAFHFAGLSAEAQREDWLNAIKAVAKRRMGRLYPRAIAMLAPVYLRDIDAGVASFVDGFDPDAVVCDLGSGTRSYGDRVVCVDGYAYDNVHVVCDLAALPFADGSIDGIVSVAVLEHVPDPAVHVAEMFRVLRPGGRVHCFFPFMQAFHASPHDYTRLTIPGLRRLFGAFTDCDARVASGPTSGLLWLLQEWLAIAASFGSERLYRALVPLTWALSPLKILDAVLIKHPAAHTIASGFAIEATRPVDAERAPAGPP